MHPLEDLLEVLHVKVTNPKEIGASTVAVREDQADHADCTSFLLNVPAGNVGPSMILQLDPLRKKAVIFFSGVAASQVFLCHTNAAAQKALAGSLNDGALITLPANPFEYSATAPLWAVPVAAAAVTVGILAERRDK